MAVSQVLRSLALVAVGWMAGYALYHGFQGLARFQTAGIEIPFSQRVLHLRDRPITD